MLAWSEELITDVRKPGNHGYDVIVGGKLFTDYSIHSQTCHAKPKTQINRRRTLQLLSRWWDACTAWPERLLSEKSGRCGIATNRAWRFTMIDHC